MRLAQRLNKLEAALRVRPDTGTGNADLLAYLDGLAARMAGGDSQARAEIRAVAGALCEGRE